MSRSESEPPGRVERFVTDKFSILVLILSIVIFVFLYVAFRQTPLYSTIGTRIGGLLELIWVALTATANWCISLIRGFREMMLFKSSKPSVSAKEGPKVLLWILDGCSVQAFLDVAERNRDLRTFYEEGYFAQCVTIFPSITPAAHSTIVTGCYPSKTRIPAFDWVEIKTDYSGGETREYVRCMPDFKRFREERSKRKIRKEFFDRLGDALDLNQGFLSPIVYTVFETLGEDWYTISIKEWIHRGADNFIGASINGVLEDLASKKIVGRRSMIDLLSALYKEVSYEFGDLLWGSESKLADFMVYWKTGTDTKSHEYGPRSPEVREEIEEAVEKLAETLRFYKMHTNQPIYVIMTSDHSQSEVTEFSSLIEDFKEEMKTKYKIAGREDATNPERINEADIIVANNDRAALFYSFGKPQTRDEIVSYLKGRSEVDLVFYVEDRQAKVVQILDDGFIGPEDIDVFFRNKEKSYPNAVERVNGLLRGDKWGDVVLSMKEGYSLNPEFRPEKEGEGILHGDHGGLNFSDSVASLLIWGPTIEANIKDHDWEMFRTVDIASTIAKIFGVEHTPTDGRVLEEVFSRVANS